MRAIHERYQKVDAEYISARTREHYNRYDIRYFIVRSLSESVASRKLRQITRLISQGFVEDVEGQLQELKITNPAYFEVYRVEAFAFLRWSDISRAITAYEAALEFGQSEPQLHFFFAGMLMRNGYCERAEIEFLEALTLDPGNPVILREASRNLFQLHKYDDAEKFLAEARSSNTRMQRDVVIAMDVEIQLHVRRIGHLAEIGNFIDSIKKCEEFLSFLQSLDRRFFDGIMLDHIQPIFKAIAIIRRDARNGESTILDALSEWIRTYATLDGGSNVSHSGETCGERIGFLKQNGRKPTFGFIVEGNRAETFVAAATLTPEVWQWLNEDGAVSFDIEETPKGLVAVNVSIHK